MHTSKYLFFVLISTCGLALFTYLFLAQLLEDVNKCKIWLFCDNSGLELNENTMGKDSKTLRVSDSK